MTRSWTANEITAMIAAMEARRGGFRVSAETAPLVVAALSTHARHLWSRRSELRFSIEELAGTGASIEILAVAGHVDVANAAYAAALESRPGACIVLRDPEHRTLKRSI